MPTFRLSLEYDGREFAGWQLQRRGQRTVQGTLQEAFQRVTGCEVGVVGAGRTDAGVHAEGQVASVEVETEMAPDRLRRALNGVLPPDLAVWECAQAPEGFHARYQARSKLYCYRIWNGESGSPLRAARAHHVPKALDVEAMRRAAALLLGTHDFAAFRAAGSSVRSTVRTLERLEVEAEPRGEIRILVEGDGFLRQMVRILAGTLIEVGLGRRDAAGLTAVLAARERSRAGRTAPAQALTLVRVSY